MDKLAPQYCDLNLHNTTLETVDRAYSEIERLDIMNAFLNSFNVFYTGYRPISRSNLKLANIDAVFNLTQSSISFDRPTDPNPFSFCDIAGGPGGFIQYMQYRRPRSIGYAITLRGNKVTDWFEPMLKMNQLKISYGVDRTGDLITNYQSFIQFVQTDRSGQGVTLVTADGSIDQPDITKKEADNMDLILCELGLGVTLAAVGGSFTCKLFGTVSGVMADALYLLSIAFEKICMIKPISSRPGSYEKYLVCISKRPNADRVIEIFATVNQRIVEGRTRAENPNKNGPNVTSILDSLPLAFENWLIEVNNAQLIRLNQFVSYVLKAIEEGEAYMPVINRYQILTYWNIPPEGEKIDFKANLQV